MYLIFIDDSYFPLHFLPRCSAATYLVNRELIPHRDQQGRKAGHSQGHHKALCQTCDTGNYGFLPSKVVKNPPGGDCKSFNPDVWARVSASNPSWCTLKMIRNTHNGVVTGLKEATGGSQGLVSRDSSWV